MTPQWLAGLRGFASFVTVVGAALIVANTPAALRMLGCHWCVARAAVVGVSPTGSADVSGAQSARDAALWISTRS